MTNLNIIKTLNIIKQSLKKKIIFTVYIKNIYDQIKIGIAV